MRLRGEHGAGRARFRALFCAGLRSRLGRSACSPLIEAIAEAVSRTARSDIDTGAASVSLKPAFGSATHVRSGRHNETWSRLSDLRAADGLRSGSHCPPRRAPKERGSHRPIFRRLHIPMNFRGS